jgi:hypothetical protein
LHLLMVFRISVWYLFVGLSNIKVVYFFIVIF